MGEQTLTQRALAALSRREYSRRELGRKLARFAQSAEDLERVLDDLARRKLLSDERFSESLVHRRAERYGNQRIVRELEEHGLDDELVRARAGEIAATELARCRGVWEKKFGVAPDSLEARARQTRFLTARGFSAETIRTLLRGLPP